MENINVQVYSLISEPISPIEKLQTIAKLGFAGAEFTADFTEVPLEEMKKVLAETGLKVPSAHVGLDKIEEVIPYFAELGTKLIICPMTDFCNKAEALEVAAELNRLGQIAKPYGIKIGYHNHTDEFYMDEGKYLYDWLIDACDPEVTAFQVDCGWCSAAGVNPVEFINSHAGRIGAIHIKENGGVIGSKQPRSRHKEYPPFKFELDENGKPIFPPEFLKMKEEHDKLNVPQGQGIVDWKAVKAAADAQCDDVIYVVEREASYNDPQDRVACLAEDIAWLKANL
ncbi:sugar phosphate isomerase/epimerase family protein [Anaeromassilibacillus senegalensis]|uniref:Sugar phosphate isomerase/epimerase n=1 Tax=Anaeromassilibacillus senegalensis TaxID=1673717 RepID=A0ABS9CPJ3_9FIRM|nr:TIM barrel protein [Anaeromassilibacillus senegalensis]MCF2653061.1 sugar phosphate isomerase/epimerase [Anaeromassilibacillus senegalensis]